MQLHVLGRERVHKLQLLQVLIPNVFIKSVNSDLWSFSFQSSYTHLIDQIFSSMEYSIFFCHITLGCKSLRAWLFCINYVIGKLKLPTEAIDLLLTSLDSSWIFMGLNMKGLLSVSLEKDSIITVELLNGEHFGVYRILGDITLKVLFTVIYLLILKCHSQGMTDVAIMSARRKLEFFWYARKGWRHE